jgi:monofunctional glycosyltransferase
MTKAFSDQRVRLGRRLRKLLLWLLFWVLILSLLPVLVFRWLPPPSTAFMLQEWYQARQSNEQARHPDYLWVNWADISPYMRLAAVAAEDQKFPHHRGFDIHSIQAAVQDYYRSGRLRGASTISQQAAKNLFLWPRQSLFRKGLEAWFTLLIEQLWPKQRILEVYLNIAEFSPGVYGVEAASLKYFGTSAMMLDASQAALLAAVLPNPKIYSITEPSNYVINRRDWILRQMRQLGGPDYLADL